MAVKVVSIVPGNPSGLVILFGSDGSPVGIVDGPTLTAIRHRSGIWSRHPNPGNREAIEDGNAGSRGYGF